MIAFGERWSKSEAEAGGDSDSNVYGGVWSGNPGGQRFGITDGSKGRHSTSAILGKIPNTNGVVHFTVNGFRGGESVASSFHPGGAIISFADGSSHFLSEDIAFETLVFMCQMGDGNVAYR